MQSPAMLAAQRSYINREIKSALEAATEVRNIGSYFFPCCIGSPPVVSLEDDFPIIKPLQKWVLEENGVINYPEIDRLAKELIQTSQRNKKK